MGVEWGADRAADVAEDGRQDGHIWQSRFYDLVVFTGKKREEKLG